MLSRFLTLFRRPLHAGDWVVVRSREEILATLDERGQLERLPFQPEMLAFCGQRLRIAKIAHKTCDTINKTGGRRMNAAVHLEGVRCSGAQHGGCQADCLLFWKTAWLRRADEPAARQPAPPAACTEETVLRATRADPEQTGPDPVWVCQTTALFDATTPLRWWEAQQYVRDVASGNHSLAHMAKIMLLAGYSKLVSLGLGYRYLICTYNRLQKLRRGRPFPENKGEIPNGQPTPASALDLKNGELVEIRPMHEILATINEDGFNRGMRFDKEMASYCGGRYRVQYRIERLINEQTGRMIRLKTPCIQLEGVECRAECSEKRLGCPRGLNHYWREIWLRRLDA
ncbi:MAG: hypothetical protein HGA47_01310 [Zoogloea sp.]|nr:hypothetical protein [Zoogloea sp.]